MTDRCYRPESLLDPLHGCGHAHRVGDVDDLVADPGACGSQLLQPSDEFVVVVLAGPADHRHRGAAERQHLGQHEPGTTGLPAHQDDVISANGSTATASEGQFGTDRLAHSAGRPDDQLTELGRIGMRELQRDGRHAGALRHPQHRDADRRVLGIDAGEEAGEAVARSQYDKLSGQDGIPRSANCGQPGSLVRRIANDRERPVGTGISGEQGA